MSLRAARTLLSLLLCVFLPGTRLDDSGFDTGGFGFRPPASTGGAWGPVLNWQVQAMHIAVLRDAVLMLGNQAVSATWAGGDARPEKIPFPPGDLHCAAQATLGDGRAIVLGGQGGRKHEGRPFTALFDPATSTWTRGADMRRGRWYPTATVLADGRLFVTSGTGPDETVVTVPEIYDPRRDAWAALPEAERSQHLYPFVFLLPDGRLVETEPRGPIWFLDPARGGGWTRGPEGRFLADSNGSAAMFLPGKILLAGGGRPPTRRAAVVDVIEGVAAWREAAPMTYPRAYLTLTILADGSVLAVGGSRYDDQPRHAIHVGEIWDPDTDSWTRIAPMQLARMYHSASALLPDGRVLVGGGNFEGGWQAQVFSPPYLYRGARPRVTSAPDTVAYGESLRVGSPDAERVARVALLRPSAVTHGFDHNQRYVPLTFTRSGSGVVAEAPADGNLAPPGDYLLFLVDGHGVPSEGRWIRMAAGR